jgi:hypothetical protein
MKVTNIFNTEFKLTVLIIIVLFIFKLFFIKDLLIILKTSLYDVIIFSLFFLIFNFYKHILFKIGFYIFYFFNTIIYFLYYLYFFDISQRGFSLTSLNLEAINFVLQHIISFKTILLICIILLIIIVPSIFILKNRNWFVNINYLLISILILILLFLFSFFILKINLNPHTNIIFDQERSFNKIDLNKDVNFSKDLFINDKGIEDYFLFNSKYKKILVFVGEEWMLSDFLYEKEKISVNNFFKNTKHKSHLYTNYYTTNQDSRTSIYTMLTSYFIPFEAYLDSSYSLYLPIIKNKNNLVDFFNYNDYSTQFVVSSLEVPDIATPFNWTKINTLKKSIYDSREYYCLDLFAYETACEDNSILEDTKQIIKENEKLFLFQEFIYGHSYKYIIDNKISRTQYYNNYFNEIYSFLEKEDFLKETIIIIIADHGSRARVDMLFNEGYNIPLIFIAEDLNYRENNNLFSHIDFKDLLFRYILNEDNIIENKSIIFVGSTNSNLIGFVDKEENFGIIDTFSNKLINYNLNENIKSLSEEYFSYYKYLQNKFE